VATVPFQQDVLGLLGTGSGAVWLSGGGQAWWIDPSTNHVGSSTLLPLGAITAVATDGTLWMLDRSGGLTQARPT
jgi:hypothetical protein